MRGINYYHESMGYIPRTYQQVYDDLVKISSKFDKIKVYHNPYKSDDIQHIAQIVTIAKKLGLYLVWNENNDTETLTEASWGDYVDKVKIDCVVANKLRVDEFLVGNEISLHNDNSTAFDDTNLPIKIKNLVQECSPLFHGLLSYEEGWWKKDAWHNSKLSILPKIYFTLYESEVDFEAHAIDIKQKFGNRAEIGEFSTQGTFEESGQSEIGWANQVMNRFILLESLGFSFYYFCFRDTGTNNNDKGFGLWKNTIEQPHLTWNYL